MPIHRFPGALVLAGTVSTWNLLVHHDLIMMLWPRNLLQLLTALSDRAVASALGWRVGADRIAGGSHRASLCCVWYGDLCPVFPAVPGQVRDFAGQTYTL